MYSLIATLSVFVSAYLAEYIARREKLKFADRLWEIILMVLLFGVIGARIYHVVDLIDYYKLNPLQILNFRAGGLGIYGGLIGGFIGTYIASKIFTFNFNKILDLFAIVLPLGQAVARWGNYFNFELYGKPYNGLLRLYIPSVYRKSGFENISYYHPLFLYESALSILLFLIVFYCYKKSKFKIGSKNFFYLYILGYGIIRYTLESLRINPWVWNNINIATLVSLCLITIGSIGLVIKLNYKVI